MKALKITFLFFITALMTSAQAPNYKWGRGIQGKNMDLSTGVAADHNGNVIATGFYRSDTLNCGSIKLVNSSHSNITTSDIYLAKYDSTGNILWAQSFGDSINYDFSGSVTTDHNNNIILVGSLDAGTYEHITFGSFSIYIGSYIVKLSPSGTVLWAKGITTNQANLTSVAVDGSDNIIIGGTYADIYMDLGSGISTDTSSTGSYTAFAAKYDSGGTPLWIRKTRGSGDVYCNSLSTDPAGDIAISGYFSDSLDIGSDTLFCPVSGNYNIFIAKYDATGNLGWIKTGGTINGDNPPRTTMDADGDVILAGAFTNGTITLDSIVLTNSFPGGNDSYVVKYNAAGARLWTRQITGTGNFTMNDICTDVQKNIFMFAAGDGDNMIDTMFFSDQDYAPAAVKLDAAGNALWIKYITGSEFRPGTKTLAADPAGSLIISSIFEPPFYMVFNDDTLFLASPSSDQDVFVTKINAIAYPPCFANYTTTYDSVSNTFSLTVDPATAAMAASYLWDFGDGNTSTLAAPTHVYANDSIYNVCMTVYDIYGESCTYCHNIGIDSSGAVNRSGFSLAVVPQLTTGVTALSNEDKSAVYPNPTTGVFSISSTDDVKGIDITNVLGERVFSLSTAQHPQTHRFDVDLSSQQNGIYFVKLYTSKGTTTKRICISK